VSKGSVDKVVSELLGAGLDFWVNAGVSCQDHLVGSVAR
jgi:hypothetical protein